jgi:hypothetical protein
MVGPFSQREKVRLRGNATDGGISAVERALTPA